MLVNTIQRGIVIDHITAGRGAKIIEYLDIDTKVNTVAFIMNASSKRHGRKDIVKIENVIDIDMAVLGLIVGVVLWLIGRLRRGGSDDE